MQEGKRLSVFDLMEGVEYDAFDGDRKLPKKYVLMDGVLHNAENKEALYALGDPQWTGCSWVPLKATIHFIPNGRHHARTEEVRSREILRRARSYAEPVSVIFLQENRIYRTPSLTSIFGDDYVVRVGGNLFFYDSRLNVVTAQLGLDRIRLGRVFKPWGWLPESTQPEQPAVGLTDGASLDAAPGPTAR